MTQLSDALLAASRVLVSPRVRTDWRDVGYGGDQSLDDLTPSFGGQYTVDHSLDDGLPSDITLTSGANASGTLSIPVLNGTTGSPGMANITVDAQNGFYDGGVPWTTVALPQLAGVVGGQYEILVVLWRGTNGSDVSMIGYPQQFRLLATQSDNELNMAIFGREYVPDASAALDYTVTWDDFTYWCSVAFRGTVQDLRGNWMTPQITDAQIAATSSGTALTTPAVTVQNTGTVLGFYVTDNANTVTPAAGQTTFATPSNLVAPAIRAYVTRDNTLRGAGTYTLGATVATGLDATHNAIVAAIAIEGFDYDPMNGRQFFSPFNDASPIATYERDVAPVTLDFGIVGGQGPVYQRLFTGQMASVAISSSTADMEAVSRSRLAMQASVQIPMINGPKAGASTTWVLHYACASCNFYASPPPTYLARLWAPMHGSMMPFMSSPVMNAAAQDLSGTRREIAGSFPNIRPQMIEGPFLTAINAWQEDDDAYEILMAFLPLEGFWAANQSTRVTADFAGQYTGQLYNDVLTHQNNVNRISLWIRGDDYTTAPGYSLGSNSIVQYKVTMGDPVGGINTFTCGVATATGKLYITMTDALGTTHTSTSTAVLPRDGSWYHVAWTLNWAAGTVKTYIQGQAEETFSPGAMDTTSLNYTEAVFISNNVIGAAYSHNFSSRLPVAELMMECGIGVYANPYRDATPFTPTLNTRPLSVELNAPGEPTQREAWSVLVDVATANLAAYRCDELDVINVLPASAFGEPRMVVVLSGGTATLAPAVDNTPVSVTFTGITLSDFDGRASIAPGVVATGASFRTDIQGRKLDTSNYLAFGVQFETTGDVTISLVRNVAGVETVLATRDSGLNYTAGSHFNVHVHAAGTWVAMSIWSTTGVEPPEWMLVATDDNPINGSVGFRAIANTGNTNTKPMAIPWTGFTASQETIEVLSTSVNAQDLDVTQDPTRIRNDTTVQFTDTAVSTRVTPVYQTSTALTIPKGISVITFSLDTPQAYPFTSTAVTSLTAAQVITPPAGVHYASFNTAPDGSGSVVAPEGGNCYILESDASSITVQFTNSTLTPIYLANNSDTTPFLNLVGYPATTADGYSTVTDPDSIARRGDRTLSVSLPYIQQRSDAQMTAQNLVTILADATASVEVTVVGDPTRVPGNLVTIADSQGTGAAGLWRIMAVKHTGNGAQYTQDLLLIQVLPVLIWDEGSWDLTSWGE